MPTPKAPEVLDNPLAIDKATVANYKIDDSIELSPLQKLAFVRDQLEQIGHRLHGREAAAGLEDGLNRPMNDRKEARE